MKRTTKNILIKLGFILFSGLFMMLAISAKIVRDKQVVNDMKIEIDHTSGNFFITEQDVFQQLESVLPDSGSTIHIEDLKELEQKLQDIAQVEKSNVFVNNTGQLTIDIQQRKPTYRVIRKNMKSYYVDQNGFKFPVSNKYTANVPLVTGFVADNGKNKGQLETTRSKETKKILDFIVKDDFLSAQFGQVDITNKGAFELIPRVGKHAVIIGNSDNLEDKMKRLKVFYREGLTKTGWNAYKTINVAYKDQVVCSK